MKIVFLIRTLTYGGAERQLVALARGLHARGHQISVVVFYPDGPLEPELLAAGIPVLSAGKHGRWDLPGFFWRLGRILRAQHAEIVHGYLGTSNVLSLLFKPVHGAKSVWGVRASDIIPDHDDWPRKVDGKVECRLSRYADLAIANSRAGQRHAVSLGFPPGRTIVIPNGIDVDRFKPDPGARQRVRTELGISNDALLVGRIGRIDPQKDYSTFLRAAAIVAGQRPNAHFLCVGAGPADQTDALNRETTELGLADKVVWTGARGDMPAVYNALDLNVSSSAYGEGTPNVVAEAMACGIPSVVTDVGDSAVTVGEHGMIVPRGDAGWLAAAMLRMLGRVDAHTIDRAALRSHVIASLSIVNLIDRTEAALESIMPSTLARPIIDAQEAGAR